MKPLISIVLALTLPLTFACQTAPASEPVATRTLEAPSFEVVPLQHAESRELAGTLSNLFRTVVLPDGDRQVKIVADPRTNSLLVMAPAEHMELVKELVARLDVEV
jgi:type II secretory pathway component GspD/PulD (secretin)